MKSMKHLFAALDQFFNTTRYTAGGLKTVGNETYGRKSMIYVSTDGLAIRRSLENFLTRQGFKVNVDYWPGSGTAEIQVSYFKGYGWDH